MSERVDVVCDCCAAPVGQRCANDCQSREDGPLDTGPLLARLSALESEFARIRPVYEAACAARDRHREFVAIEPEEDGRFAEKRAARGRWLDAFHAVRAAVDGARAAAPLPADAKS